MCVNSKMLKLKIYEITELFNAVFVLRPEIISWIWINNEINIYFYYTKTFLLAWSLKMFFF